MSIAEEGTHPLMTIFLFFPFDYHTAKQYENHAPSTKPMHIDIGKLLTKTCVGLNHTMNENKKAANNFLGHYRQFKRDK